MKKFIKSWAFWFAVLFAATFILGSIFQGWIAFVLTFVSILYFIVWVGVDTYKSKKKDDLHN